MDTNGQCKHDSCSCPVVDNGSYCSDFCKDAAEQDINEIGCGCGHASCGQ